MYIKTNSKKIKENCKDDFRVGVNVTKFHKRFNTKKKGFTVKVPKT